VKLRSVVVFLPFALFPVVVMAQPVTGPYVTLAGGLAIQPANSFRYGEVHATGNLEWQPGFSVIGGVGYGFGDGIRIELDGDLVRTTANKADGTNGDMKIGGAERNYGALANLFYDIPVAWPVTPYVGAGAGYQYANYNPQIGNSVERIFGTRGSFAYDLIGGVSYPIPGVPGLAVIAEYRFMQLTSHRNYLGNNLRDLVGIGPEISNSFLVGLRYQLFQPSPPPPPPTPMPVAAPAPAPAKTYLVFFDWDKYNLTPRALDVISQAAADSKSQSTTTIQVSGYTDTSGTPTYNMGLSQRRATAVANQLVIDGVPATEIETHAFGETHLLVPTGPGVREPQNRRVEIDLQ
jgi:outer membrane protein OmpA-like peptidoglycan-associated protein/opacity protein-like surface antigen